LLTFNFRVEYKSGASNVAKDVLSRRDADDNMGKILALSVPPFQLFDDLQTASHHQFVTLYPYLFL
jgi:hypothetical protein